MGLRRQVMLHYTKTGLGQQVATIPWISSDFTSLASPVGYNLRDQWWDSFGNSFVLKKGSGTIAQGNVVAAQGPVSTTVQAGSTTRIVNTNSTYTANQEIGNFFIDSTIGDSGTNSTDNLKIIKGNSGAASASTITVSLLSTSQSNQQADADAYVAAPSTSDQGYVYRPDTVVVFPHGNSTTEYPVGIAVQAIATTKWGFVQIRGIAQVSVDGVTAAWAAKQPVVPSSATDGFAMGQATVQLNAKGALVGQALNISTANSSAVGLGVVALCLEQFA